MSNASFDEQLKALDGVIEREEKFVKESASRYASAFMARRAKEISALKAARETVRAARQDKQMTGMNGRRIDEQ